MIGSYALVILIGATLVTYGSRLVGLYAGAWQIRERNQRILAYVPIGAFTAIVVLGFTDANGELDSRIPAAFLAGALAIRRKPLWLCLVCGLAVYAVLRFALDQ